MKAADLIGPLLDYYVAVALGKPNAAISTVMGTVCATWSMEGAWYPSMFFPSADWKVGGPLLEEHRITSRNYSKGMWWCTMVGTKTLTAWGTESEHVRHVTFIHYDKSLLVAAMRCLVESKLGAEVPELPKVTANNG